MEETAKLSVNIGDPKLLSNRYRSYRQRGREDRHRQPSIDDRVRRPRSAFSAVTSPSTPSSITFLDGEKGIRAAEASLSSSW